LHVAFNRRAGSVAVELAAVPNLEHRSFKMMTESIAINCAIIFFARVMDVALGTIRTIFVIRGNRIAAWMLGFVEILIWIWVVSEVIQSVKDTPYYALFYAMGFATGNYVGITIERRLAFGDRAVLLFTRRGTKIAREFRGLHYAVTEWEAKGREGAITLLFLKVPGRLVRQIISNAKQIDPSCFFVVENVELTDKIRPTIAPKTGWRAQERKAK
jgi:uncharacterized protein YebE (UPF0316 family)